MVEKILWEILSPFKGEVETGKDVPVNPHFDNITGREHCVRVPVGPGRESKNNKLPQVITGSVQNHSRGVECLVIEFEGTAGYYEFEITWLEQVLRKYTKGPNARYPLECPGIYKGKIYGKEIDYFLSQSEDEIEAEHPDPKLSFNEVDQVCHLPDSALVLIKANGRRVGMIYAEKPNFHRRKVNVFKVRKNTFRFFAPDDGKQTIEIIGCEHPCQFNPGLYYWLIFTEHFLPVGYRLKKANSPVPFDSLKRKVPGKPFLDVWGWELPLTYQREKEMDIHYARDVLQEAVRWGANLVEVYISLQKHGFPPKLRKKFDADDGGLASSFFFPWSEDGLKPGREKYKWVDFSYWNAEHLRKLSQLSHELRMYVFWYMHYPRKGSYFILPREDQKWVANLFEMISREYANSLSPGRNETPDALETESCNYLVSPAAIVQLDRLWKYNPGMTSAETACPSMRLKPGVSPALIKVVPNGCSQYLQDDMRPWGNCGHPPRGGESEYGSQYFILQADCRTYSWTPFKKDNPVKAPFLPGKEVVRPDIIIKQTNDYFRERVKDGATFRRTGIWWLGQPEGCIHPALRDYVYGTCMDPIRGASSTQLLATGKGGTLESVPEWFSVSLGARTGYPANWHYAQNNFLRFLVSHNKDDGAILIDPECLGHYDDDSLAHKVISAPLKTIMREGSIDYRLEYESEVESKEFAGEKAALEVKLHFNFPYQKIKISEKRRIQAGADQPFITITIDREVKDTYVTLPGHDRRHPRGYTTGWKRIGTSVAVIYDTLKIGSHRYQESIDLEKVPASLQFLDSRKLAPPLEILLEKPENFIGLSWSPGREFTLWTPSKSQRIRLGIACLGLRYKKRLSDSMVRKIVFDSPEVKLNQGKTQLRNSLPIAQVRIAALENPNGGPYFIREGEFWNFRGGQPSREKKGIDFVKVYQMPGETSIISSSKWIENVVAPGWGSQYQLSLADVKKTGKGCSFLVRVHAVTPVLFAPRVHFNGKVAVVKIDGKSWHYFDEEHVFLPNQEGDYRLEVEFGRQPVTPSIVRTFARIVGTQWDEEKLTVRMRVPVWTKKVPRSLHFRAVIAVNGRKLDSVQGGEVEQSGAERIIVCFRLQSNKESRLQVKFV